MHAHSCRSDGARPFRFAAHNNEQPAPTEHEAPERRERGGGAERALLLRRGRMSNEPTTRARSPVLAPALRARQNSCKASRRCFGRRRTTQMSLVEVLSSLIARDGQTTNEAHWQITSFQLSLFSFSSRIRNSQHTSIAGVPGAKTARNSFLFSFSSTDELLRGCRRNPSCHKTTRLRSSFRKFAHFFHHFPRVRTDFFTAVSRCYFCEARADDFFTRRARMDADDDAAWHTRHRADDNATLGGGF